MNGKSPLQLTPHSGPVSATAPSSSASFAPPTPIRSVAGDQVVVAGPVDAAGRVLILAEGGSGGVVVVVVVCGVGRKGRRSGYSHEYTGKILRAVKAVKNQETHPSYYTM